VNRSAPDGPVIPVLTYPDVRAAVDWIVEVLGFVERVRIGPNHRAQLSFGRGSLIVADATGGRVEPAGGGVTQSVMLRVDDVAAMHERVRGAEATIVAEPQDFEYGERQSSFVDPWGHLWTLTQTLRDVRPEDWGGTSVSGPEN
jgi:uncharacterized glyoxalase superfamily protein PhnB